MQRSTLTRKRRFLKGEPAFYGKDLVRVKKSTIGTKNRIQVVNFTTDESFYVSVNKLVDIKTAGHIVEVVTNII